MASYGSYSQRAARTGLDHIYTGSGFLQLIQFCSSEEGLDCIVQKWPRSDLHGLVRFQPTTPGPEASQYVRIIRHSSGRMQLVCYQFPTFTLSCILLQTAQIMLCKSIPDPIWFWLTVSGFGQTDPVRKQAGVQESLGPLLANASKLIRIRCKLDPACLLGGSSFLLHLHAIAGCCYSYMNNTCVPVCFVWLCLPVFILSSNQTGWLGVKQKITYYHLFLFAFNYCRFLVGFYEPAW